MKRKLLTNYAGRSKRLSQMKMLTEDDHQGNVEQQSDQFQNVEFTTESVYKKLLQLDSSKAPGPDGMHPHLLISCVNNVAKPLAMIFYKSFHTGLIPQDWKLADISPIFKKGVKRC